MTVIYLIRHAHSEANGAGILAGRLAGNGLSKIGRSQAKILVRNLPDVNFSAIYSSPLQRCQESITPYANSLNKRIRKLPGFIEMDYGRWSGRPIKELRREKLWKLIQSKPSQVQFPEGESFLQAHRRIKKTLNAISRKHPKGNVIIVSHGDVIKLAVQATLGGALDEFQRIVIDPASLTVISWPDKALLRLNLDLAPQVRSKRKLSKSLVNRRLIGGGSDV